MNDIKISVLIPAYNVENYIVDSIDSILKQSFQDFEIIIIDDKSTDSTWQIVNKYQNHPKIKILQNKNNIGISKTRNKLIEMSSAKYIVWQDSDDISYPDRLKEQYDFMELNPQVGISAGYIELFDKNGNIGIRKYPTQDEELRKMIFKFSPVPQPAAIIRRECFEKTGKFPEASPVAEDLAMSFQIGTKYQFGNLPKVLIKYRQSETNITHQKLQIMELYSIFLRFLYSSNPSYKMTFTDRLFNYTQFFLIFLIPTKYKIWLFNAIRNIKS